MARKRSAGDRCRRSTRGSARDPRETDSAGCHRSVALEGRGLRTAGVFEVRCRRSSTGKRRTGEHLALRELRSPVERRDDSGKRGTEFAVKTSSRNEKRPPGNRAAFPSGRIVPTEASHQNFLGEYYGRLEWVSRLNPDRLQVTETKLLAKRAPSAHLRHCFAQVPLSVWIILFDSGK